MLGKLIIKNNNWLLTKGTKYVELDFKDLVNIFMGRNGFGKTTILREAHPLPPENSDYTEGGYKYVKWIVSPTLVYEMESWTGSSSTHNFKRNGVELNTGHTLTVQRDLCLLHLGLTPQLIRYMTGIRAKDLFTLLAAGTRKQIFMDMYPNDTQYAFKLYNKIKEELRNTIGALKNQHFRLSEEEDKAAWLQESSIEEIESNIESLEQSIKDGMVLSGVLSEEEDKCEYIESLKQQLKKLVRDLLFEKVSIVLTEEELVSDIEQSKRILTGCDDKVKWLRNKITEYSDILSANTYALASPEALEEQLEALEVIHQSDKETYANLEPQIKDYFGELTEEGLSTLTTNGEMLIERIQLLTLASNENLTLAIYSNWLDRLSNLADQGRGLKESILEAEHFLKHFDGQDVVSCPECSTEFKPGFDVKEVEQKRKVLAINRDKLEKLTKEYRELKLKINNDEEFYQGMTKLMNWVQYVDDQESTLFNFIKVKFIGYREGTSSINALRLLSSYQKTRLQIKNHSEEIQSLKNRIAMLKRNDIREITLQMEELEYTLASVLKTIKHFSERLRYRQQNLDIIRARGLKLQQLEQLQEDIIEAYKSQGRFLIKEANSQALMEWVPAKDKYVQQLIRGKSALKVIESIKENIAALEDKKIKLQLLADGLCPNKGLIGKLMADFIKTVVGNMNAIIREVFTTPLFVLPCINKKGELTYNFPVINSVNGKPSKDVSDCSGGEQDIINFAFRMVLMRYKGNGFPLVLDEVGIKLDSYHQNKFFEYISRLTTSEQVKQILMVSHFMTHIGMFNKASVIALNSEGIDVPKHANQLAKFK